MLLVIRSDNSASAQALPRPRTRSPMDPTVPVRCALAGRLCRAVRVPALATTSGALRHGRADAGCNGHTADGHPVSRRRREIGVRMAVGATSRDVCAWCCARALTSQRRSRLGIAGAVAAGRLLRGLLYGVSTTDSRLLAVAPARYRPIIRPRTSPTSRIDPNRSRVARPQTRHTLAFSGVSIRSHPQRKPLEPTISIQTIRPLATSDHSGRSSRSLLLSAKSSHTSSERECRIVKCIEGETRFVSPLHSYAPSAPRASSRAHTPHRTPANRFPRRIRPTPSSRTTIAPSADTIDSRASQSPHVGRVLRRQAQRDDGHGVEAPNVAPRQCARARLRLLGRLRQSHMGVRLPVEEIHH